MEVFGKNLSRNEIIKKIGDISQLGGIKYYEFIDGMRRGVRAIDIKSPCGLDMTVLVDRAMDISYLSYKSIPLSWRSVTKETSPSFYESRGDEIARTFYGGLFLTCGLTYMGEQCIDNEEELGLHGRISNISAENISIEEFWEDDDYVMIVRGRVREVKVLGDKLQLSRKITTWMGKLKVVVEDEIENIGSRTTPLMVLYHVNIGYPLLDKQSELILPSSRVIPRDKEAKKGIRKYSHFTNPVPNFKQQVFFHEIEADEEGNANVALINETLNEKKGLGLWLKYNKDTLPYLIQCKQMGGGEYFCAIEPANSFVRGRKIERKDNNLKFIKPGEKVKNKLEFILLTSNSEINEFRNKYSKR